MAELTANSEVTITITRHISRAAARKTLERLFMKDNAVADPIAVRSRNFKELPKRRGGCIWTKRPNKIHAALAKGDSAKITATAQAIKDLKSVAEFVSVA